VKGSKGTKRACMARGRTPVVAWMGTLEVDFCPPVVSCETYIFSKRREVASEGIVVFLLLFVVVVIVVG
jgi:hypothetical protein